MPFFFLFAYLPSPLSLTPSPPLALSLTPSCSLSHIPSCPLCSLALSLLLSSFFINFFYLHLFFFSLLSPFLLFLSFGISFSFPEPSFDYFPNFFLSLPWLSSFSFQISFFLFSCLSFFPFSNFFLSLLWDLPLYNWNIKEMWRIQFCGCNMACHSCKSLN